MLRRAAGLVAASSALVVNAILLPPGVNNVDESLDFPHEAADAHAVRLPISSADGPFSLQPIPANSHSIRIPCAECAFSTKQEHVDGLDSGDEAFRIEGGANDLLLRFTASTDSQRLELNGGTVYPPEALDPTQSVMVYQVPATGDGVKVPLKVTSSGLLMDHEQPVEDGGALVTVRYTILGVEKQLMTLRPIKIDMLKTTNGLLLIGVDLDKEAQVPPPFQHGPPGFGPPFDHPHGPPPATFDEKECNILPAPICRFKQMLEVKIARIRHGKPCPGMMGPPNGRLPSHIRPPFPHRPAHGGPPRSYHRRPHHMKPWHGHGHGHHGHHRWGGAFVRGFAAVLIPVVAGIAVGLTVSLFGLIVGRLITFIWMRYARHQPNEAARSTVDEAVEEGKGLMLADEDEVEELPAYEDAPAYKEADDKFP